MKIMGTYHEYFLLELDARPKKIYDLPDEKARGDMSTSEMRGTTTREIRILLTAAGYVHYGSSLLESVKVTISSLAKRSVELNAYCSPNPFCIPGVMHL